MLAVAFWLAIAVVTFCVVFMCAFCCAAAGAIPDPLGWPEDHDG